MPLDLTARPARDPEEILVRQNDDAFPRRESDRRRVGMRLAGITVMAVAITYAAVATGPSSAETRTAAAGPADALRASNKMI